MGRGYLARVCHHTLEKKFSSDLTIHRFVQVEDLDRTVAKGVQSGTEVGFALSRTAQNRIWRD